MELVMIQENLGIKMVGLACHMYMKIHSPDGSLRNLTALGIQQLSETVQDYAYLILTSQTNTRGPIVGHEA